MEDATLAIYSTRLTIRLTANTMNKDVINEGYIFVLRLVGAILIFRFWACTRNKTRKTFPSEKAGGISMLKNGMLFVFHFILSLRSHCRVMSTFKLIMKPITSMQFCEGNYFSDNPSRFCLSRFSSFMFYASFSCSLIMEADVKSFQIRKYFLFIKETEIHVLLLFSTK